MNLIRFALVFCALALPALADTPKTVVLQGDHVTIIHDGSASYYDPHTEAGRLAIGASRGTCCVQAPAHWHGLSEGFGIKGDLDHNLSHESMRFVVNPRTGAFISVTSLVDDKYVATDPKHYVDSDFTPMVALSPDQIVLCGCKLGDRVLLTDTTNHQSAWAVYGANAGDQESALMFMGISAGAAAALHIPLNYVTGGVMQADHKLTMTIYPGSGYGKRFPHGPIPPVK